MMRICIVFLVGLLVSVADGAPKAAKPTPKQVEENTRLQIFLDNASFGPGKIDGQGGEFTQKALAFYNQANGLAKETQPDLSSVEPVFVPYTVTKEDMESVGELPSGPAAQAKVKRLPYASIMEAIAEKFHCDLAFLKGLNAGQRSPKAGGSLTVPNVKPFDLGGVKALTPGSAAPVIANEFGEEKDTAEGTRSGGETETAGTLPSLHVSIKDEIVEVRAGDKTVAMFPVTVGSQQTESPVGHWVVKAVAKMPNFRYDPLMLKKGERSSHFHLLPPGPNNPVGVVWIALNKKGIGLHGTNDPDSIGRNASHGCIRLANWDIVKLAELVKPGTLVTVE